MYVRINNALEISFGDNFVKSVASGVAGNLGGLVAGILALGSLLKAIPIIGTIPGAAIVAATAFGITYVSALIYIKTLTALVKKKGISNINEEDIKAETDEQMEDKDALKNMINAAKNLYKKQ
jgi:uncharacterized protein (DUF697 family)